MTQLNRFTAALGLLFCASLAAQQAATTPPSPKAVKTSRFLLGSALDTSLIVGHPPSDTSAATVRELEQLHKLEAARTPQDVQAAQADDVEQDIFIYRNIFGSGFTAENLPQLAALSTDVHNEEAVASTPLKNAFARPRPYQLDSTLHPACKITTEHNSYPSGHTLSGYLLGYTMAYIAPDKKDLILARTDVYAQHRLTCGVHYASDLVAAREIASAMFGAMLTNPVFRARLVAAQQELQQRLTVTASR
ncbi:phosphatase PAP2 family protein [Terriglobus sp. RCC_193]|uniref:phosphatase PAP2 family protein n=1 Tax=Terriglobus sp. RCC_193 TaxID=3239218 RepID=UPI0035268B33